MPDQWIVVPGWEEFQHPDVTRTKNAPAWIKVYTRLLSDDDYLSLTLAQRGLLHGIWIEYARSNAALTVRRTRMQLSTNRNEAARITRNLEALNQAGFIAFSASKPASNVQADIPPREEKIRTPQPPASRQAKPRRRRTRTEPTYEEKNPHVCGIDGCTVRDATAELIADHRENVHGITTPTTSTNGNHPDTDLAYLDTLAPDDAQEPY